LSVVVREASGGVLVVNLQTGVVVLVLVGAGKSWDSSALRAVFRWSQVNMGGGVAVSLRFGGFI
jgi:hypothetical protein